MNSNECVPYLNMASNRVALMSDIHSNYHAFKACYEDAVKCGADSFIFLGDYISDLAEPQKTMELVYKIQANYPTVCLRGNREEYMLDCESGLSNFVPGSKSGSLLFTYNHLRKKDLDFLAQAEMDFFHCDIMDGQFVPNLMLSTETIKAVKQQFAVPHRKNVFAAVDDAVLVRDGNAGAVGRKPFRRFRSVNNDNGRIPVRFPR